MPIEMMPHMTLAQVQVEAERLEALRRLSILHSEQLPEFEAVISNIAHVFDCPIALVSIVEQDEIWFKAAIGLDATETHRENSFCGQTILSADVLVVPDAREDDRFKDVPLVTGDLGARFYAGCPITVDGKHRVGTICVVGLKPCRPSKKQITQLRNMARVVEGLIKVHKANLDTRKALHKAELEHDRASRNHELLEEVTLVSGVGGWEYDPTTGKVTWNARTCEIHEVSEKFQPDYDTALTFYPPASRKLIEDAIHECVQNGSNWDLELQFVTAKGHDKWVRAAGHPVFEGGSVRRIVGAIQDITGRKRKEDDIRTSEAVQRTTFEALREGILLISPVGRIQSSNPAAAELLGCCVNDLTGSCVHELQGALQDFRDEGGSKVNPLILAVTDPGELLDREVQFTDETTGLTKWLQISAKPVDANNEIGLNGVVVSLTDITRVRQQADTLQVFFDNFPGGLVHYDSERKLTSWNDEFARLLNLPEKFLSQRPFLKQVIHYLASRGDYGPGDANQIAFERLTKYGAGSHHAYERKTKEGKVLEVRGTPLPGGGSVSSFLDISARKRMEEQLVEKERLASNRLLELETVIANMRQGVTVFDRDGRITLWNQHFMDLFGKVDGEIAKGMHLVDVLELERARSEFKGDPRSFYETLRGKLDGGEVVKTNFSHPNGKIISIVRIPLPDGGWIGTHEDVTSREKATEEITYAAHHDTLTGLANRTLFNLKLEDAIKRAELYNEVSDLLMIDLDRFKPVNDTYGHDVGDVLLRQAAVRLKDCVRAKDTVARLGGDEFAIIVRNPTKEKGLASKIARRIVDQLKKPYLIDDNVIEISTSVGIAAISDAGPDASPILKRADIALYAVKNEGRDGYRHFKD